MVIICPIVVEGALETVGLLLAEGLPDGCIVGPADGCNEGFSEGPGEG